MLDINSRIYVAGHRGLVGSAIVRLLTKRGYKNILMRTHQELDLTNQRDVMHFFFTEKPDHVILAAAKVGGIYANNTYPAEFIYENLMIETNVIHASYLNNVQRLLFLGSSCIYPKAAEQPMREEALLTGKLEPTNEPYALAKIAGIKLCESYNRQYGTDFRSVMPTNLYGEGDNFHPENSHVVPALLRRFHEAKRNNEEKVVVWGSGKQKREFLYVDDMACALLHVLALEKERSLENTDSMSSHINIGTGSDCSIRELAETIKKVVGFKGTLVYDREKPDGSPRKLLCNDRIKALGWEPKVSLDEGLRRTYQWYLENIHSAIVITSN